MTTTDPYRTDFSDDGLSLTVYSGEVPLLFYENGNRLSILDSESIPPRAALQILKTLRGRFSGQQNLTLLEAIATAQIVVERNAKGPEVYYVAFSERDGSVKVGGFVLYHTLKGKPVLTLNLMPTPQPSEGILDRIRQGTLDSKVMLIATEHGARVQGNIGDPQLIRELMVTIATSTEDPKLSKLAMNAHQALGSAIKV